MRAALRARRGLALLHQLALLRHLLLGPHLLLAGDLCGLLLRPLLLGSLHRLALQGGRLLRALLLVASGLSCLLGPLLLGRIDRARPARRQGWRSHRAALSGIGGSGRMLLRHRLGGL